VPRVCVGRLASACVIYKEFVPWVRKQVIWSAWDQHCDF
jgi:hypothetical protein